MIPFYLNNALISLNTAKIMHQISLNSESKKQFDFITPDFEAYLWVINSAYYSMFYTAGALLASMGIKIKTEIGIHKKTFEAMTYYFYLNNKIAKKYLEEFLEAQQESTELLGITEPLAAMQKKAKELLDNYDAEMGKRAAFTYNIGIQAKESKATTSLNRANEFYNECLRIMTK